MRTPYDKSQDLALTEKDYFPPRGYVLVVQDTRGRFSSEGEFYPFVHEALDGYDTIEWAAALPWSNGVVGTVGQSYLGLVQYYAATTRPPHLKAMCPVSGPVTYFQNCVYRRGVFELGWMLTYFTFMARNTLARKGIYDQRRESPRQLHRAPRHSDLATQGRGVSASADFRLGGAPRQGRALLRRLPQALEGRRLLGRDRSAQSMRQHRRAGAPRRLMVRRVSVRYARDVHRDAR